MRGRFIYRTAALAVALSVILLGAVAASPTVTPTNSWIDLYSAASTYLGQPVPAGALVAVYDPHEVLCGQFTVATAGHYGLLPCYADDPLTPALDEGADLNDVLHFTIDGLPASTEVLTIDAVRVPATTTVIWAPARSVWQVNLQARLPVTSHTLATSAAPARVGDTLAITSTVTGSGPSLEQPSGTVQFRFDDLPLGTPVALSAPSACASLKRAVSEKPLTMTAFCPGRISRIFR